MNYESIRESAFESVLAKRPIANISFALNYYFHGYDLPGYHLVNTLIHIMTGMFLYFFIKTTLETVRKKSCSIFIVDTVNVEYIAFAAVLIWAVHPLQTQSVTYIVQRMNSMAVMFYMLSMLMYVKARLARESRARWALYGGCVASGIFALGSKEIAATLPVFIFLYEWYFFQDLDRAWLKRNLLIFSGILAVFGVIAAVYLGIHPFEKILNGYGKRDFTLVQRVLTELRIVPMYLGLIFFPHPGRLNLDYDFPLSHSLLSPPSTLISLLIILGLIAFAIWVAKKDRLVSFSILWFFGNLVIESSVIGLELVYEHRTYLPSMFVILAAVLAVHYFLKNKWAWIAVLCCVVGLFSVWTWQRNLVWADDLTLWHDCLKKSPDKARPHTNYALVLMDRGRVDEAVPHFERAIELAPNIPPLYRDLGDALSKKGKIDEAIEQYRIANQLNPGNIDFILKLGSALEKKAYWDEAGELYERSLEDDPLNIEIVSALGRVLAQQGRYNEASSLFMSLLDKDPERPEAYNGMGNVLVMQGREFDAIDLYTKALGIDPDHIDAHNNLGRLFFQRGELEKAIEQFREIVRIDQDNAEAQKNLAASLQRRDNINTAIVKVENDLNHDPQNQEKYYHLGELYRMKGSFSEALDNYEKALSIMPEYSQALRQIAVVLSSQGYHAKAVFYLEKVIGYASDDPDAYYNLACMYSLMNDTEKAVLWLKHAVEKGFDNWELMGKDPDLNNIRMTEYFKNVLQGRDDE